jgi:hypothetical protein
MMKTLKPMKIESCTIAIPCLSYNAVRCSENEAADELAEKCDDLARLQAESWAVAMTDSTRINGGLENESRA